MTNLHTAEQPTPSPEVMGRVRNWLTAQFLTHRVPFTHADDDCPQVAVRAEQFFAFLMSIGADVLATATACDRAGWTKEALVVLRLRAIPEGEEYQPPDILRVSSIRRLPLSIGHNSLVFIRQTVLSDGGQPDATADRAELDRVIAEMGLKGVELRVAEELASHPNGVPISDWPLLTGNQDWKSAANRLKPKFRKYGWEIRQDKKMTKLRRLPPAEGAKRGAKIA